ncbi:MAG TPA: PHP domain-containing protein [Planctomycetota bacterium]|nr:PHP domain-containing protein [Planctomycetota bacterium]
MSTHFPPAPSRPAAPYDLHLHTYWSYDAEAAPELHFRAARDRGVKVIAITEHHVLDSQAEVREVAVRYPEVRCIAAAELTVTTSIGAVDLLCYGFPATISPALQKVLEAYHAWQRNYGAALSSAVRTMGYPYSDADRLALLRTYRPEKAIAVQGNTHVQNSRHDQYFIARGFVKDAKQVKQFRRRIQEVGNLPAYPSVREVVPAVKAAGALVVIAHPHGYFNFGDEARMDQLRVECQLDGIECAHLAVPMEFTPVYRAYCVKHGLVSTGGSDSHTQEDIDRTFGRHGGDAGWLEEFLGRLRN